MKTTKLIIMLVIFSIGLSSFLTEAETEEHCVHKWEYFSKSYALGSDSEERANWRISAGLTQEGEKGWELVQVLPIGKIQYVIFKRIKMECASSSDLSENKGLEQNK